MWMQPYVDAACNPMCPRRQLYHLEHDPLEQVGSCLGAATALQPWPPRSMEAAAVRTRGCSE